ncbi:hypothetical protein TthSNM66_11660 [Thermus thermophilus]|uniref:hypothetical protein n=1 Tax=Thermus thermophilus TaxID=274 RepID=UPI001FCBB25B|nr:hypothetical protein [Thermus thermophilus]BDG26530.1 hypothetical protein TthSNM66_11660 [Thermus thermophilus]
MSPLTLLHALHRHPTLAFRREGGGLRVLPRVPEEARPVLGHFKPALLRALEEGERLEASTLLRDPHRLAALLAHALGGEAPVVLTGYYEGPPTRYLVAVDRLTPYLAQASRHLPAPRRLHLAALDGRWAVDVVGGWEVALEARAGGTRYVLLLPALEARAWVEAAREGLVLHAVSVWRPGEAPAMATGWKTARAV